MTVAWFAICRYVFIIIIIIIIIIIVIIVIIIIFIIIIVNDMLDCYCWYNDW